MDSKVKTILVSPFRQFTCCISVDGKEQEQPQKKAPHKQPCMTAEELQRYQKSIELENKKRAAFHQQRNAERAVMRTHFRQKYQLSQNSKDNSQMLAAGGSVRLPEALAAMVCSEKSSEQEGGLSFFGAFPGLDLTAFRDSAETTTDQCRVM
ncbi:complexin-3 [Erpetoichthys calabaricus]|uniref:complexin-3 n=1 Tax=Erpetoichthys calabaricus TaxID=27687 RepID=UPI00109F3662|nr:complexin-3 [Erpetoichthys calabaricus]